MNRPALTASLAVIFLAAAATARAQLPDQVFGEKGTPIRGTVTAMTPNEVTVGTQKVPVNEIRKISYGDDTPDVRAARDRVLAGQLEDALDRLKKINVTSLKRAFAVQDVEFYHAYCMAKLALAGGGDKNASVVKLRDFTRKYPNSYHFYEANELIGDLAVALKSYTFAEQYYGALLKAPWPEFQMRAAVLAGRAQIAQKKYADAQKRFEQVIGSTIDSREAGRQKRFAQIGRAVCLAAAGDTDAGIKLVNEVIAKNDPSDAELFGRAYNALGLCHLKAGQDKDALLAYLHVHVLFFGDADSHAESLYHLGSLWALVNKSDRAVKARNLLQNRYAGTRWASEP